MRDSNLKSREYMGVTISQAPRNYGGFRWEALTPKAGFVYADTLDGIKRLIRENL